MSPLRAPLTGPCRIPRFPVMPAKGNLEKSITLHGILFFLAQGVILITVALAYRMGWHRPALFFAISAAYHAGLTALLLHRKADFHLDGAPAPLVRVNLSNTLTLGRLSAIPTILFLIMQASSYPILPVLLPLMILVFGTDTLDGMVARRRHEITYVGRYLDSSSDYLMIITVSIIFFYYLLIPLWFFILIMCRFVFFALGMVALALRQGKPDPLSTFLGKASIFALMVLYVMEIAGLFGVPWIGNGLVVRIVEYVVALIVAVSMVDKAIFLRREFLKTAHRQERIPPASGSV
jgi:phosphatidylglycerophosphate synthase